MYQRLYPLVKQFGSQSLSISTLQPSCQQFVLEDGFISYFSPKRSNRVFVLGDPICSSENTERLLRSFIKRFPKATFTQVSEQTANVLRSLGYKINTFGEEHVLDTTTAYLSWSSHKSLKRESNKAKAKGITVKVIEFQTLERDSYQKVSNAWLKTRKSKHKQHFLTRPLPKQEEPDTLYLGAYHENTLVGFSILSPMYKNKVIIGYYSDITRYLPSYSSSLYLLHFFSIQHLKRQNIKKLSLGMSCYDIDPKHQHYSHPFIKYLLKGVMKWGNELYAFKQMHHFKLRFHGTKRPRYFATHSRLPILYLLQIFLITTGRQKA